MSSQRVLIVASQHGDELLGEQLYDYIQVSKPQLVGNVSFILANPRARKLKTRYISTDMNRSYVAEPKSYEERRAAYVKKHIEAAGYDVVLDLHTTTCDQKPVFLVRSINVRNKPYLRASRIEHVIEMQHNIVQQSLIGVSPQAVSIEVSRSDVDDALLSELADDIARYVLNETGIKRKYVYKVDGLLLKADITEQEASALNNLQKSAKGYYPVLVGEKSYKKNTPYLGFRASEREKVEV